MKHPTPWNINNKPNELDNFSIPRISTITTDFCEMYVPDSMPYKQHIIVKCKNVFMAGNNNDVMPVKNTTTL